MTSNYIAAHTRRDDICDDFMSVSNERASVLARACTDLVRKGNDFPTVWATKLKGHPLVIGIPHHRHDGTRSLLDIPLIMGERLVFDGGAKKFGINK